MKKKVLVKVFSSLTIIVLLSNTLVFAVDDKKIENEINNNSEKIDSLEEKKNQLDRKISTEESQLSELQQRINSKASDLQSVEEELNKYNSDISALRSEIDDINLEIASLEAEVNEKEDAIKALEEEEEQTKEKISYRIRTYAKMNFTQQYIYALINSNSLSDAMRSINNIYKIVLMDRKLISEAKEQRKEIDYEKEQVQEKINERYNMAEEVAVKESELADAIKDLKSVQAEHKKQLAELDNLEEEKNLAIKELQGESDSVEEEIEQLTMYNEELQAQLDQLFEQTKNEAAANEEIDNSEVAEEPSADEETVSDNDNSNDEPLTDNNSTVAESGFLRPVTAYISEYFGARTNPVTGNPGNHNGVDFASQWNEPIKATKGGVVSYADYWGDFGNIVIINHGDGMQSFYAHASSLNVSVGQTVSQGQVVAYVGSTGMSTGPHLHFEIRINGAAVNPLNYIPE